MNLNVEILTSKLKRVSSHVLDADSPQLKREIADAKLSFGSDDSYQKSRRRKSLFGVGIAPTLHNNYTVKMLTGK